MELKRGKPLSNKNLNGGKDRKGEKFMAKKKQQTKAKMTKAPKYSAAEKRAYNIGRGIAACADGENVSFRTQKEYDSFVNGLQKKRN